MKNLKNQSAILKTATFVLLAFFAFSCEQESVAPKDVYEPEKLNVYSPVK